MHSYAAGSLPIKCSRTYYGHCMSEKRIKLILQYTYYTTVKINVNRNFSIKIIVDDQLLSINTN